MNTSIPSSTTTRTRTRTKRRTTTIPTIIGFSQSRLLWDTVRQKQYQLQSSIQQLSLLSSSSSSSSSSTTGSSSNTINTNLDPTTSTSFYQIGSILVYDFIEYIQSFCIAIGYEIQFIRYNELKILYNNCCIYIQTILFQQIQHVLFQQIPDTIQSILIPFVIQHYKIIIFVIFYYIFVRIIHNLFHAGPIIIILSLLIIIYQFGLDDSTTNNSNNNNNNNVSAYSVFNKGFTKLMGSIDVDDITNQYISGGMVNNSSTGNSNGRNQNHLSYRGGTIRNNNRIRIQRQLRNSTNTTSNEQQQTEEEQQQLSLVRHQRRTTTSTNGKRR